MVRNEGIRNGVFWLGAEGTAYDFSRLRLRNWRQSMGITDSEGSR